MALVSSDSLLVPLQTEFFALEGVTQLIKTIERIKNNLNPDLSIRILLTMYDKKEINFLQKLKKRQEVILKKRYIKL